jgi:Flp pilus assembly protein TadD
MNAKLESHLNGHAPHPAIEAEDDAPGLTPEQNAALLQLSQTLLDAKSVLESQHGLTAEHFALLYERGLSAYHNRDFHGARADFAKVLQYRPLEARYHMAFASALQQLGEYRNALLFFTLAAQLRADDPGAVYRIAECLIELDDAEGARQALQLSRALCRQDAQYASLSVQADQLLTTLH